MGLPRSSKVRRVPDEELLMRPRILIRAHHPPTSSVKEHSRVDACEVRDQCRDLDPSLRESIRSVEANLARLVRLGNEVCVLIPLDQVGIRQVERTIQSLDGRR